MYNAQPLQLRQVRDLGQNISDTFLFLRQNWKPIYAAIGVVCVPPLIILGLLMKYGMGDFFSGIRDGGPSAGSFAGFFGIIILLYVAMLLMYLICFAMVNEYMGAYVRGEHAGMTVRELLRRSFSQFWSYFGIGLLSGLMLIPGFMLCFIPGIYLWANIVLAPASHAVERSGATGAISRSFQLTKNNWWESFAIGILIILIQGLIGQIIQMPLSMLFGLGVFAGFTPAGNDPEQAIQFMSNVFPLLMIIGIISGMITYPISSVAAAMRYFTLVEKREQTGLGEQVKQFDKL